jgi:hypothetical protein
MLWILGFPAAIWLVGFAVAVPLTLLLYLKIGTRERRTTALPRGPHRAGSLSMYLRKLSCAIPERSSDG